MSKMFKMLNYYLGIHHHSNWCGEYLYINLLFVTIELQISKNWEDEYWKTQWTTALIYSKMIPNPKGSYYKILWERNYAPYETNLIEWLVLHIPSWSYSEDYWELKQV